MNWTERLQKVETLGLVTPKTQTIDVSAIVQEALSTYEKFLAENNFEFDRNEFMKLASGWREGLKTINATAIPDVTHFFTVAEAKRADIRNQKLFAQQQSEWFAAIQRCEVILDAANYLKETEPEDAQDIIDMAEMLRDTIRKSQAINKSQIAKIDRWEQKLMEKLS